MKINDIISTIEKHAPLNLALEFDTPGLYVGKENDIVSRILVCENVTMGVLEEAKNNNCEMIISHHPAIFGEINDCFTFDIVKKAKKEHIALYSAHTNLDSAVDGINERLCEMFNISMDSECYSCYRIGKFIKPDTLANKAKEIGTILKDSHIRTVGQLNSEVKTVCISCGAGARDDELVELLKDKKVDVLIGGENKLSLAIKMQYYNINLIEVGHYTSEIICMEIFKDWLKPLDLQVIKSERDINPYND